MLIHVARERLSFVHSDVRERGREGRTGESELVVALDDGTELETCIIRLFVSENPLIGLHLDIERRGNPREERFPVLVLELDELWRVIFVEAEQIVTNEL